MKIIQPIRSGLDVFLRWFCIVLFIALVALVVFQVLVRQVFHGGFPWTEAAGRYVFIWLGLIGAAYVIGENDDVAIDFLVRKFPPAVAKAVEILAHGVVAFFAVWVMILGGWRYCAKTWGQPVELLPVTNGQVFSCLVVAGGLIAFYSIIHIIETVRRKLEVKDPELIDISTIQEEGI